MRSSTRFERPTVSTQNGRPICLRTSSDSAWSSSEKNGFGPIGGISWTGRKSTASPSRSWAMRRNTASSRSRGSSLRRSIRAATSWVTAADSRRVTVFQCRSMNTKATTDCRITIGAMMMRTARA